MENYKKAPKHIKFWSKRNPKIAQKVHDLQQEGVRLALYGGTVAELGNLSISSDSHLRGSRVDFVHNGDDIDLRVHNDDFERAVDILGAEVKLQHNSWQSADGYEVEHDVLAAHSSIDGRVIEICQPCGPIIARNDKETIKYDWTTTDLSINSFVTYKTRHGIVPIAKHDTMLLYGILQRSPTNSESDLRKATLAVYADQGLRWDLRRERLKEVSGDIYGRVDDFFIQTVAEAVSPLVDLE